MNLVNQISRPLNYGITSFDNALKKVVSNPGAIKKVLTISTKLYSAYDLYTVGHSQKREITRVMTDSMDLIGFYSTFKHFVYWANPFTKNSLDKKTLMNSIESSLCASHKGDKEIAQQRKIASQVYVDVMNQSNYYSKREVYQAIQRSLEKNYPAPQAQQIAERVIVQKKKRPLIQLMFMGCSGMNDFIKSLMTLKNWQILDLSPVAASVGEKSRVFRFLTKAGSGTVLATLGSVALSLSLSHDTYKVVKLAVKHSRSSDIDEKNKIRKKIRQKMINIISNGTDFVAAASPLFFTLNPATLVAMSLISKGTGLVCILIR